MGPFIAQVTVLRRGAEEPTNQPDSSDQLIRYSNLYSDFGQVGNLGIGIIKNNQPALCFKDGGRGWNALQIQKGPICLQENGSVLHKKNIEILKCTINEINNSFEENARKKIF